MTFGVWFLVPREVSQGFGHVGRVDAPRCLTLLHAGFALPPPLLRRGGLGWGRRTLELPLPNPPLLRRGGGRAVAGEERRWQSGGGFGVSSVRASARVHPGSNR